MKETTTDTTDRRIFICDACKSGFTTLWNIPRKYCGSIKYKKGCLWLRKKEWSRQYSRARYYKYRDELLKKHRAWYLANYEKTKEKRSEYSKQYYQKNKAKILANCKRWREANPELVNLLIRRHHFRKTQTHGDHTVDEWMELKNFFNNCCASCGRPENAIKLTEDHKVPLSKGGGHGIDNIQPLCKPCNSSKSVKTMFPVCSIINRKIELVWQKQ